MEDVFVDYISSCIFPYRDVLYEGEFSPLTDFVSFAFAVKISLHIFNF